MDLITFLLSPVGVLIILNTIVFLLPNFYTFSDYGYSSFQTFLTYFWNENDKIKSGEYYRLLTSIFLHADVIHLVVNMWALFVFGSGLSFFPIQFLAIYFLSGIIGSLASYFFNPNPSVGASGAIFGLVGFILAISIQGGDFAGSFNLILYIVTSFVISALPGSRIDLHGHAGGLLTGILLAFIL